MTWFFFGKGFSNGLGHCSCGTNAFIGKHHDLNGLGSYQVFPILSDTWFFFLRGFRDMHRKHLICEHGNHPGWKCFICKYDEPWFSAKRVYWEGKDFKEVARYVLRQRKVKVFG